jgi:DNA-binding protein H-NS
MFFYYVLSLCHLLASEVMISPLIRWPNSPYHYNIDPEELLAMTAKAPKKHRASRPAKYKFIDEN